MINIVGFDIESTGIDPLNDRIVTFSIVTDIDGCQTVYEWLIDPGVDIPTGASDVHGVTTEMARADGLEPKKALETILETLQRVSEDGFLTAYNCPFDLTMLREELIRHEVIPQDSTYVEELVASRGILDPLVIDKAIDQYRRGSRKLIDVAEHYGFSLTNAHNSTADVEATIHLAKVFLGKFSGKATMQQLLELQADSKIKQAESLSAYFKSQGREDWEVNGSWPIYPNPRLH